MTLTEARDTRHAPTEYASEPQSFWIATTSGGDLGVLDDGGLRLTWPQGAFTFPQLTPGVRAALVQVASGGAFEDELLALVQQQDGMQHISRLYLHLNQLMGRGRLTYTAQVAGEPVLRVRGMSPAFSVRYVPMLAEAQVVLSRFAVARREGDRLVLETPLVAARGEGSSWLAGAVVALLASPTTGRELVERLPQATLGEMLGLLQLLANLGVVVPIDAEGLTAEDRSEAMQQWGFTDLLFHSRSRFGRHDDLFGGNFRHAGKIEPLPAVRPPAGAPVISLPKPDLDAVRVVDPSLTDAIESRVSVREYGDDPITLPQLSEFLYRVARVRGEAVMNVTTPIGPVPMEVTSRPYPNGGASYELEFYLTVDRCAGLDRGIYHYDPRQHRLGRVREDGQHVDRMLWYAGLCAGGAKPQVLVSLGARFGRVGWKYDSIAYAAIQKNVGVVYQTMYLVATAMGLGACGLGSGDADMFAEAMGTDYLVESSVGDFMLGSLPNTTTAEPVHA